ncbi:C10 family peptidase [Prevotella sp. RM4]|uniref:C10 family peptidase n=1 Tax=Prevotella sp. RM4 TaxID=1200547 RepID=UPI0009FD1FC6|nr:C10 family peptidase [Prevotella sp. RM4]
MHHILRYFTGLTFTVIACASMQAQEILPLIQTQWGQAAPYNMFCPKESLAGPNSLAGCGALAMAQVMRYLQEPSVSPKGEKYQWDLMPQRPSTPEEARAIARLVTDCGVNAFTAYGKNSSGTNPFNVLCAMKKCFGLNPYIYIIMREQYPGDEGRRLWRRLIMDELQGGRPVMMIGSLLNGDKKLGHIFIIDGVRGSRVHVNFGWDGKGDGYYALDDLGGFNINQSAIIGIGKADYVPESKVVKTEHAGQLAELLPQNEWKQIRHLRVSGPLDKSDFKVLQQMAQMDRFVGKGGDLHTLDLRDAEVEYLPDSALCATQTLFYVRLPKKLKQIGRDAFNTCIMLNEVDIPSSVWRIRKGAFNFCPNLLSIHIPEGVRNILSGTFCGCKNLTEVTLPESIDTLGAGVFENCTLLERLYIPASTHQIGVDLVKGCPNLREVIIDPANKEFAFCDGKIVGLTKRAQEQLGQISHPSVDPKNFNQIGTRRVRKVKAVKRNGKWVEVK